MNKKKKYFFQNVCGAQEKTFTVVNPGQVNKTYTIQMGDELLVAPLSLFYPDLLKITGPKNIITQKAGTQGDPDDPFDENYLRDTSRKTGREAMEVGGGGEVGDNADEDVVVVDDHPPSIHQTAGTGRQTDNNNFSPEKLLSLDQAILGSIERCGNYFQLIYLLFY